MKSKTLALFEQYEDELQNPESEVDVTEVETGAPSPEKEIMPMTSEGENEYISNMIDAALFEPSPEDANTLNDLRSMMDLKQFTNAREEVLPTILNVIRPSTESSTIRNDLDDVVS